MKLTRRVFLKGVPAAYTAFQLGLTGTTVLAAGKTATRYRKIAVEEGFMFPELAKAFMKLVKSEQGGRIGFPYMEKNYADLTPEWTRLGMDLGEGRIRVMDENGISMQLISLSAGGIQWMDTDQATHLAAMANDRLADAVHTHPRRFAGLAALAPQNPDAAVKELERAVTRLGLKGAIITSNVRGEYLDNKKYWAIFETAQALDVPIYLHPTLPAPQMLEPYKDYALIGPMAGFSAETSVHTLRLIMCGLFDEFPRLRMVLGHLGEGIPFFLDRIDRAATNTENRRTPKLKRLPSEYFHDNFVLTTSGMNSPRVVKFCIDVLGSDHVLFAIDYPYERMMPDATALDNLGLPEDDMNRLFHGNAERVFKL